MTRSEQEGPVAQDLGAVSVGERYLLVPVSEGVSREEPSLRNLFGTLWRGKWWIVAFSIIGIVCGILIFLTSTHVYRAEILVAPAPVDRQNSGSLGNFSSQLGGIASLAGVGIPPNSMKTESLAIVASDGFISRFIQRHTLMPVVFESRWDPASRGWRRDGKPTPTVQDGVNYFRQRILIIKDDRKTGLVTFGIELRDRLLVAPLANALVAEVNAEQRHRALDEAARSIAYLNGEVRGMQVTDTRSAIFDVIEGQIRTSMLANVRKDFAFKILDQAQTPDSDKFVRPRFLIDIAAGLFLGCAVGVVTSLLILRRRSNKSLENNYVAPAYNQ